MAEVLAVVGMFVLRLGVPMAVTLAIGYWLRRLDAKWQAEAMAEFKAQDSLQKEILAALDSLEPQQLCRKSEGYEDVLRKLEPDCALLDIPCWLARLRATGKLPLECRECELFAASLAG